MTEDEYLRLEETSEMRHEYWDGEIVDMAGGAPDHAGIALNFGAEIRQRLKGGPCRVFGSDLAVRISQVGNYFYPDLTVVCGPLQYSLPDQKRTITNPTLVVEVITPDSEKDDRGRKFTDYRRLESLKEYILVSQQRPEVETFYRQADGVWAIGPTVTGIDQSVHLRSLEMDILLAEIFTGVVFPPEPPARPPVQEK